MDSKVNITNDVLAEKIDGLDKRMSELQHTTQNFTTTFVTHEVFELRMRAMDLAIKQVETSLTASKLEIVALQKRKLVPQIMTALLSALLTAAFTYLLYARIQGQSCLILLAKLRYQSQSGLQEL